MVLTFFVRHRVVSLTAGGHLLNPIYTPIKIAAQRLRSTSRHRSTHVTHPKIRKSLELQTRQAGCLASSIYKDMEQPVELAHIDPPSIFDWTEVAYKEIGILSLLIILISIAVCLFIALKAKPENKEYHFRRICIAGIFTSSWLVFDSARDLMRCFNYSTSDGKMPVELVLINIGERAFQIQAIAIYMAIIAALLLLVHSKKEGISSR